MAETVKGIQDAGVIACAKHFVANEQVRFLPWAQALNSPSAIPYSKPHTSH